MRREEEKNFLGVISHLLRHEGMRNHGLLRNEWQTLFDWSLVLGELQAGIGERIKIKLESSFIRHGGTIWFFSEVSLLGQ